MQKLLHQKYLKMVKMQKLLHHNILRWSNAEISTPKYVEMAECWKFHTKICSDGQKKKNKVLSIWDLCNNNLWSTHQYLSRCDNIFLLQIYRAGGWRVTVEKMRLWWETIKEEGRRRKRKNLRLNTECLPRGNLSFNVCWSETDNWRKKQMDKWEENNVIFATKSESKIKSIWR